MIKNFRNIFITAAGIFTVISSILFESTGGAVLSSLIMLLWLFGSYRIRIIHLVMLPVHAAIILIGFFNANPVLYQAIMFIVILAAWDIDALFINSYGLIEKEDELLLIKPLLFREGIYGVILLVSWYVSSFITIPAGFWPLALMVYILILMFYKLVKNRNTGTE